MALAVKNRRANEFKAQAEQIRADLLDASKEFTKDEVEQKTAAIAALEARAELAAGFTPEDEIERQGGDAELRRANPDNPDADKETRGFRTQYERAAAAVVDTFGGPNRYLLRLAQRQVQPMTEAEQRVHRQVVDLHQRAIVGTGSHASGGEFLLPLQQVAEIFRLDNLQQGIAGFARRYAVAGRTLRIPYLIQDDGDVTRPGASIANVTIVGEGDEKPEREPKFQQRLLTVFKYAAYTELGDETLADDMTGELSSTVQEAVGTQALNALNEHVTRTGAGTTMPIGAFHTSANPALLKVEREAAGAISTTDIFNMYARLTKTGGMRNGAWFYHPSALPGLLALTLGNNTLVSFLPGLNGRPVMTLLGLPMVETPLMNVLGAEGDIGLANGEFYAMALRQALTVESSIHYKFRHDLTAFRFVLRGGGIPIPTDTYAYESQASSKVWEHSPFVVLDDVVASSGE